MTNCMNLVVVGDAPVAKMRPRRSTASRHAQLGASDAPGRGRPAGGGAAASWPLERHRRRPNAAAESAHGRGGGKLRRAIFGEEVEAAAAETRMCFDWRGEGPERRHRARRPAGTSGSRVREKGEGISAGVFTKKPSGFPVIASRTLVAMKCGLRVRFTVSEGFFLQNRHGRALLAVGSPFDGRDGLTVAIAAMNSKHCSQLQ